MHPRNQRIGEITYSRGVAKCPLNLLGNWLMGSLIITGLCVNWTCRVLRCWRVTFAKFELNVAPLASSGYDMQTDREMEIKARWWEPLVLVLMTDNFTWLHTAHISDSWSNYHSVFILVCSSPSCWNVTVAWRWGRTRTVTSGLSWWQYYKCCRHY